MKVSQRPWNGTDGNLLWFYFSFSFYLDVSGKWHHVFNLAHLQLETVTDNCLITPHTLVLNWFKYTLVNFTVWPVMTPHPQRNKFPVCLLSPSLTLSLITVILTLRKMLLHPTTEHLDLTLAGVWESVFNAIKFEATYCLSQWILFLPVMIVFPMSVEDQHP